MKALPREAAIILAVLRAVSRWGVQLLLVVLP
jgi:hypothetical protein